MNKILRIFVSSVGQMMEEERETLRDRIWKSGHIPIAMEGFSGNHDQTSIDIVKDNLEKADVILFVLGFTYGSVIGKALECNTDCPVKKVCPKYPKNKEGNVGRKKNCKISYTHFEYLYAKQNGVLHYCIIQEKIDDAELFKSRLEAYKKSNPSVDSAKFYQEYFSPKNRAQILLAKEDAMQKWSEFYDANNPAGIRATIAEIYLKICTRLVSDAKDIPGLIDGRTFDEDIKKKGTKINALKKELKEFEDINRRLMRQQHSNQPNTAITGTCIPFFYDEKENLISTYLIRNSAYTGNQRFMFPGGHAFVNDEPPETVAAGKAYSEAGLNVKIVDLYHSYDMSGSSTKSLSSDLLSSDFTIYRPPHYTYLFEQNKTARCYEAKNHLYHYDAVYVFEITEILDSLHGYQKRIKIELPNKLVPIPYIRELINGEIEKQAKLLGIDENEKVSEKMVYMLFEAHRDYVSYLSAKRGGGK